MIYIVDDLDGEPVGRAIGDRGRSDAHVLVVMPGQGNGPEYAVMHPDTCAGGDACAVAWSLGESGYWQPSGYPQIPTTPGLYLVRLESVRGGWLSGSYAVEHDAYIVDDEISDEPWSEQQ